MKYHIGEAMYPVSDENGFTAGWIFGDEGAWRICGLGISDRRTFSTKDIAALAIAATIEKLEECNADFIAQTEARRGD